MYDEEYDNDAAFLEEFEIDIDPFVVDGTEYWVCGTLRVEYYTEQVEIDYPTMTRREPEFVVTDIYLDVEFIDMDDQLVTTTTNMENAINNYFDKTKVLEMLRDGIY